MTNILSSLLGNNWRTTLVGLLGAALVAVGNYINSGGHFTLQGLATAAGVAALGFLSKDSVVTGGTVVQPTPPATKAIQQQETADPKSVEVKK